MNKPLDFITVVDTNKRQSSLGIHGRKTTDTLRVTGILEHGAEIEPASIQDADKWIAWLQEWKEKH